MQLLNFSDCGFGGGATAAGPRPGQVLLEALHKRLSAICRNQILRLFTNEVHA
jgi:hypothetical protein